MESDLLLDPLSTRTLCIIIRNIDDWVQSDSKTTELIAQHWQWLTILKPKVEPMVEPLIGQLWGQTTGNRSQSWRQWRRERRIKVVTNHVLPQNTCLLSHFVRPLQTNFRSLFIHLLFILKVCYHLAHHWRQSIGLKHRFEESIHKLMADNEKSVKELVRKKMIDIFGWKLSDNDKSNASDALSDSSQRFLSILSPTLLGETYFKYFSINRYFFVINKNSV